MKRWVRTIALVAVLAILAPIQFIDAATKSNMRLDELSAGIIIVDYESTSGADVKVRIAKGSEYYTYDMTGYNRFPLQMGDGTYEVMILEQVTDTRYRLVEKQSVSFQQGEGEQTVYLQSIQNIQWDESSEAVHKAAELVEQAESEQEKLNAIYDFVIQHVAYDEEKARAVTSGYIPSVSDTYEDQQGICYDYAALMAAMLRSAGIPTKLMMGYTEQIEGYHAWNEVYMDDEWVIIDPTLDAAYANSKQDMPPMVKDAEQYTEDKQY